MVRWLWIHITLAVILVVCAKLFFAAHFFIDSDYIKHHEKLSPAEYIAAVAVALVIVLLLWRGILLHRQVNSQVEQISVLSEQARLLSEQQKLQRRQIDIRKCCKSKCFLSCRKGSGRGSLIAAL